MKIIIVQAGDILKSPPTINLINVLKKMKIDTVVISTETKWLDSSNYIKKEEIDFNYEGSDSAVRKLVSIPELRSKFWNKIDSNYDQDSVIWVVSNITLKFLGNRVKKYRYILHFLELSDSLTYYKKLKYPRLNAETICNSALCVVVPEYNRAHIMQANWNLNHTPMIFSNKPYISETILKDSEIRDRNAKNVIEKLTDKKIILYQGILDPERPLDRFIEAVSQLGEDYAFVVMSGGNDIYKNCGTKNYYFIPFVAPPFHLEITSHAYIGVLSYFPTNETSYSKLNTLYCAPNKTFEFGMFGIPMVGNNIPGLRYLFNTYNNGRCFDDFTVESICETINEIEDNYNKYSNGSRSYYDNTDSVLEVKSILDYCKKRNGIFL